MRPKKHGTTGSSDLFRARLDQIINMKHELVALAGKIDWDWIDGEIAPLYSDKERPGIETRFVIGLLLLKHIYGLSDEGVCERWVHDPYFQHFTGEEFFQHEFPHERSDLSHWRKRLGDKLERLLAESLRVAHESGALRTRDLKRVTVDTTVQPTRLFLHELLAVVQMPEHLGAVRCIQALQAQILPFEFVQKILLRDLAGLSALLCRWCHRSVSSNWEYPHLRLDAEGKEKRRGRRSQRR
jgi:hypothetical protein